LLLGFVGSVLAGAFVARWLVKSSLRPIGVVEQKLSQLDAHDPRGAFAIPRQIPRELEPLVEKYQALLERIGLARLRERDFSANAAHELRTPLAGIQATLEQTLAQERSGEEYRRRVEKTLLITGRLRILVGHLLRFSRLQNGTEKTTIAEVEVTELMR
jgi:signal transduction histidine kinase